MLFEVKVDQVRFGVPWKESFISTEGAGPHPQSLPCYTALFLPKDCIFKMEEENEA